jgi:hypothetical protein
MNGRQEKKLRRAIKSFIGEHYAGFLDYASRLKFSSRLKLAIKIVFARYKKEKKT